MPRGLPLHPPNSKALEDIAWSIAGVGVGGTPRGRRSTCQQRDNYPLSPKKNDLPLLLGRAERAPHPSHCF